MGPLYLTPSGRCANRRGHRRGPVRPDRSSPSRIRRGGERRRAPIGGRVRSRLARQLIGIECVGRGGTSATPVVTHASKTKGNPRRRMKTWWRPENWRRERGDSIPARVGGYVRLRPIASLRTLSRNREDDSRSRLFGVTSVRAIFRRRTPSTVVIWRYALATRCQSPEQSASRTLNACVCGFGTEAGSQNHEQFSRRRKACACAQDHSRRDFIRLGSDRWLSSPPFGLCRSDGRCAGRRRRKILWGFFRAAVGAVKPSGWIEKWLERQVQGLSGTREFGLSLRYLHAGRNHSAAHRQTRRILVALRTKRILL